MVDAAKPEAPSIEARGTAPKKPGPYLYLGFIPVLLLLALVIGCRLFLHAVVIFEPHFLLPAFNTFLFLASGIISYIALRSYLISGASTILWLGCGVLTLGTGALAAGWLIYPFGPNVNVTIFNVSVLLAAMCHTGGVLANLEEKRGEDDLGRRRRKATLGYLAVLMVMALLVYLTLAGIMPPFFIQGKGPTVIRQYAVEWAIVLLIFASLVIMNRFLRKRAPFLFWYSLALALVALSMVAFFLQPAVGSPIGWVGRSSYVVAAIYFLISVSSALRDARTRGVGLDAALAELFGPGLYWQEILATVSDAVVSHDDQGRILLWNKAAARIFGYPEAEVIGKGLDLIMPDPKAIDPPGFAYGITEMDLKRKDGSWFSAEVSLSRKNSPLGVIFTLIIRDISARKQAEEALRDREAQLQTIFDHLTEGVVVSTLDGQFLTWNRAALKMHGFTSLEECRSLLSELPDIFELDTMEGDVLPLEQWPLSRILRGEQLRDLELHVRRQDKQWERIYNYGGALVRDPEGSPLLAIVSVADVTERKRAEEALRQARDELEQRVMERTTDLRRTVEQLQWEISERQRADEALRESEERLRFLNSQLLNAQETERKRLALELHDDLGQSLMVLKMQLRAMKRKMPPDLPKAQEEVGHSHDYINNVIENVRRMSRDLRPSILEDLGLVAALKHLIKEFSKFQQIQVSLKLDEIEATFSPEAQIAIYRIFQESLTNIAKHAQATRIYVTIKPKNGNITFRVGDNGNGFDLQEALSGDLTKRGLGLTAMDERIRSLGGKLNISSKPGAGTSISFVVPKTS